MKVIDVINFYYDNYKIIRLEVKKERNLNNNFHTFSKNEAYEFLEGFYDREAVSIDFETPCYLCDDIRERHPYLRIIFQ